MVNYTEIENILRKLDLEYNNFSSDIQMPILFSKLAVIEFCGWIEESFDQILFDYIDSHIIYTDNSKVIKKFIDDTYGFNYEKHTFKIFSAVIGINDWENILDQLPIVDSLNFKTILKNYSKIRNTAAHTHSPMGTTKSFDTPSMVLGNFNKIKPAIEAIEIEINKL